MLKVIVFKCGFSFSCFQVIKGAEILEVLHSLPAVRQYLFSLYECSYAAFFQSLGKLFLTTIFQVLQLLVSGHSQLLWSSYSLDLELLYAENKKSFF